MQDRHAFRTLLAAGVLVIVVAVALQAEAAAVFSPVASDCSEDVTDAFNAWLASVPDGSTIHLAHNGCYLSNGTIVFENMRNITIRGHGATIKASGPIDCPAHATLNGEGYCIVPKNPDGTCPANSTYTATTNECAIFNLYRAQLKFNLGGDIVVRDLTVQGSNFTVDCGGMNAGSCFDIIREADRNIDVYGSDSVVIHNVHFKNAWSDAFQVSPNRDMAAPDGSGAVIPQNITIQYSTVDTAGRHGFTSNGVRNFIVRDNTITNVAYTGIAIEVETQYWMGDLTAERNTFSKIGRFHIHAFPHRADSTFGPIVIRNNVTTEAPWLVSQSGIVIGSYDDNDPPLVAAQNVEVSGNQVWHKCYGIQVVNALQADVIYNTVYTDTALGQSACNYTGIRFVKVGSGSIRRNTVLDASLPLEYTESPTVTVCGNRYTATGAFDQPVRC